MDDLQKLLERYFEKFEERFPIYPIRDIEEEINKCLKENKTFEELFSDKY